MYKPYNMPMSQFQVFHGFGRLVLVVRDTSRYHPFYGFNRFVTSWEQAK